MKRPGNAAGVTLVEAIVSMAILVVTLLPIAGIYLKSSEIQLEGGHYLQALNVARGEMERAQTISVVGGLPRVTSYLYGAPAGAVDWPITQLPNNGGQATGFTVTKGLYLRPARLSLMDVVISVTWQERSGQKNVTLQTSLGPHQ